VGWVGGCGMGRWVWVWSVEITCIHTHLYNPVHTHIFIYIYTHIRMPLYISVISSSASPLGNFVIERERARARERKREREREGRRDRRHVSVGICWVCGCLVLMTGQKASRHAVWRSSYVLGVCVRGVLMHSCLGGVFAWCAYAFMHCRPAMHLNFMCLGVCCCVLH